MADLTKLSVAELRARIYDVDGRDAADELARRAGANERLVKLIEWALGEGDSDFPPRPANAGIYYWRTELRRRLNEALAAAPRADASPSDERLREIQDVAMGKSKAAKLGPVEEQQLVGEVQFLRARVAACDKQIAALTAANVEWARRHAKADAPPSDAERDAALAFLCETHAEHMRAVTLGHGQDAVNRAGARFRAAHAECVALMRSAPAPAVQGDEKLLRAIDERVANERRLHEANGRVHPKWIEAYETAMNDVRIMLAQPPAAPAPDIVEGHKCPVCWRKVLASECHGMGLCDPPAPSPEAAAGAVDELRENVRALLADLHLSTDAAVRSMSTAILLLADAMPPASPPAAGADQGGA